MKPSHTLIRHRDIQSWVSAHRGMPAIARVPDSSGSVKARLCLSFERPRRPVSTLSQDDGMSPCSWSAWLAELDRQELALAVRDQEEPAFELVPRSALH